MHMFCNFQKNKRQNALIYVFLIKYLCSWFSRGPTICFIPNELVFIERSDTNIDYSCILFAKKLINGQLNLCQRLVAFCLPPN